MKAIKASLLSTSILLFAVVAVTTIGSASEKHDSAMQIQGRPVTAWVADINTQGGIGEPNPALDVLVSAGPRVLTNLADLLLHDPSTAQQVKAADAIGVIANRNPGAPELPEAVPALAFASRSKDLQLRVIAIQGLGPIGKAASNTIPLLVRSTKDQDKSVRMSCLRAKGLLSPALSSSGGEADAAKAFDKSLNSTAGDLAGRFGRAGCKRCR